MAGRTPFGSRTGAPNRGVQEVLTHERGQCAVAQVALPARGRYGLGHGRRGPYFNRRGRRRGTLMRHFLASRAVAALALRVRQAPRKARLVARAGCPQRGRAGTLGAAGGAIALPPIAVAADQHCRAACSTEIASSGRLHGPWGRWETRRQRPLRERLRAQRPRRLARVWGATLGMTWRFEPVSRLRCHRPSPIVRASATRVPNALPPDCTNTPPAIGAPGSGAFPVALRAPSNAPDPIKQTAAIRSPDQGHAVPCRRWTPDLCGNRPPLTNVSIDVIN